MLRYEVVDVFTDRPFTGNPLAVVLDAGELSGRQMQAVAREFHLSETAFPLPASDGRADYRLRIFTPEVELPFAGHPSVGAAWVLAALGRLGPGRVVQSCGAGLLPVDVAPDGGPVTLGGGAPTYGPAVPAQQLLAAVGLSADDAVAEPGRAGCGLEFTYLLVRPAAVARAVPDLAALRRLDLGGGLSLTAWDGATAHSRVFVPAVGVPEDPATGSAALGLGSYLVGAGLVRASTDYVVLQGAEVSRPSRMGCRVEVAGGAVTGSTVTGAVARVARGELVRPA